MSGQNFPRKYFPAVLLILLLISLLGFQHIIELRAEEPRRAIVSMEMVLADNFALPTIHGEPYYNKPPLFNWLMAGAYQVTGSFSEWVVRLPALLSLLLMVCINFLIVRSELGQKTAFWSSVFLFTSGEIMFYGSVNSGEIDLFYSMVVFLQAVVIFRFHRLHKLEALFILSYFLTAVGFLTKGLPSLAFQALTLLAVFLYHRQWKLLFHPIHFAGIALFTALVGGYFYWYSFYADPFPYLANLIHEASHKTAAENTWLDTAAHLLKFPAETLKILLPWALLIIPLWKSQWKKEIKNHPWLTFSILFIVANLWLYWISSGTKNRYLYMFMPFFMVLLAHQFELKKVYEKDWFRKLVGGILVLVTLAMAALPFIPALEGISNGIVWAAIAVALGGGLLFLYFQKRVTPVLLFVGAMILTRLAFNVFYLPTLQADPNTLIYRSHVEEILAITGDEAVYFTGPAMQQEVSLGYGGISTGDFTLTTPPLIPYQVPYYLSRHNGKIMKYHTEIQADQYYLAAEDVIAGKEIEAFYRFKEKWTNKMLVLFKLK